MVLPTERLENWLQTEFVAPKQVARRLADLLRAHGKSLVYGDTQLSKIARKYSDIKNSIVKGVDLLRLVADRAARTPLYQDKLIFASFYSKLGDGCFDAVYSTHKWNNLWNADCVYLDGTHVQLTQRSIYYYYFDSFELPLVLC